MHPRTKASLLWGLVGGLSYLVLVQGYELVAEPGISVGAKVGVALLVGAVTVGVAYGFEGRFGGVGEGEMNTQGDDENESRAGKGRI